ncbi:MAG: redox-sensing transcriptional repressor Rex [Lachnospiraceae bacterium]|jgi:redox-sensing transcriptional repressor|nr:redox-sensing transcriptional repressor Rex [Lachnospiraceae bacterium]
MIDEVKKIPKRTLNRLPMYLSFLKSMEDGKTRYATSPAIAKALKLNEVQVRKDLACVSSKSGRPKIGFDLMQLIRDIEYTLGYAEVNEAIVVGVGNLGKALLTYPGFEECGVKIIAAFDHDPNMVGEEIGGKNVFALNRLRTLCERMKIPIGIIAVPEESAQEICDRMVESGIKAIWNFAPIHLTVPDDVVVRDENLAVSLSLLAIQLKEKQ